MSNLPAASNDLRLGNSSEHQSYSATKLAVLTSQLSILSFVMNAGYVIFDLFYDIYHSWLLLSLAALLSLVSYFVNKKGYHFPAKLLLGLTTNLTIFVFSSLEPAETGLSFLFIICALGAITTLGLEQRKLALLFVLLPVLLFFLSIVVDPGFFTRRPSTPDYVRVNMIINFIATFTGAVLMYYFMLNINHHSENALRENERRLHEKNDELMKVNKELDRFVYSASHDLRSPISSVRGLISLVKLNPQAAENKTYLEMMDTQLIGLNKFIEDIVVYSRNSRVEIKKDIVPLAALIDEILASLRFYPGSEKIETTVHIPAELTLQTDSTRLRIVLANLISNAFKYSNHRQEKPFIKISAFTTPAHVHVSIQDNGAGIDPAHLTKIFDMFFQVNEKSEGSGLGLYIVKETLQKIQGDIRVQSEVGKGSEFIVTLPC